MSNDLNGNLRVYYAFSSNNLPKVTWMPYKFLKNFIARHFHPNLNFILIINISFDYPSGRVIIEFTLEFLTKPFIFLIAFYIVI